MSDASAGRRRSRSQRQRAAVALEIVSHAIEPFRLLRPDKPAPGKGRFTGAVAHHTGERFVPLARGRELERRERSNGFEHLVERTARHRRLGPQKEALVHQAGRRREDIVAACESIRGTGEDGRGRLDRKTARQRAEATEQLLLVRCEQLIAPGHRGVHGLLALGEIARANRRKQRVLREPSKQIVGGQHLEPRRRELERERERVEAPADRGDGSGVGRCQLKIRAHVPDARHEQPDSWRALEIGRRHRIAASFERERADAVFAFAPEAKRRAAGREHAKRGDRRQQIGDERRRVQHLLEVVEHQQRRLIGAGEAGEPG